MTERSAPIRYGVALFISVAALGLRLAFGNVLGPGLPFILFFPAIALSAYIGGMGPGLATTILCALTGDYFLIEPRGSFRVDRMGDVVGLVIFTLVGLLISVLYEGRRLTTARLLRSEEQLRVTLLSIADAVVTTDGDGRVTQMNPVAESMTGHDATTARGQALSDVLTLRESKSAANVSAALVRRVMAEGRTIGPVYGHWLVGREGREHPVDVTLAPKRSRNGNVAGAVIVCRDVTERRLAEQERETLLERERSARAEAEVAARQLESALEAGRMGTWEYIPGSGIVKWSAGLEAIHGYPTGTFPGNFEAFREEIHPDDRERVARLVADAIENERDHHVEYRIVRRDGAVRWVEGLGQFFPGTDGNPARMVGVCTDITERREAREQMRLAVEASPAALVVVNADGHVTYVNATTARLFGYEQAQMIGMAVEQLVPERFRSHHPDYRSGFFEEPRPRPMGAGRDLHARRADGTEIPVEIGLTPISTSEGTVVVAAVTDITARRNADEVLRQAKEAAEVANRMKDAFLATLSHELRTPLQSIISYVYLLRSGNQSAAAVREALDAVYRNAQVQSRLVDSLLDLSRIEAGKLDLRIEPVDLAGVISAAVEVVRNEASVKGVTIRVHPTTERAVVMGDAARLQQIVWNLLLNAIKFTPADGAIDVTLRRAGQQAQIVVADTGQGIEASFLPFVFERFTQAPAGGESHHGLGIGLAIVHELANAHGGSVTAESAGKDRGSTFTVTLPLPAEQRTGHQGQTPLSDGVSPP